MKSTFDFILNAANKSPKRGGFRMIDKIDAIAPLTVSFHLKELYASFLWNLIPSAAGIVPANAAPDFSTKRFPPDGANRGHYRNPRIDALTDQIRVEMDQEKRKALCSEVQKILADDLPYIPMWFTDVVSVHRRELGDLQLSPTGDYDFLATLRPSSELRANNPH